jgi:hypothetical protein
MNCVEMLGHLAQSLPPPALCERRHRGLAILSIAVRRRAIFVMPEEQCPHPGRAYRGRMYLQDTTDHDAIGEHVEIVVVPLAGRPACGGAFENQARRTKDFRAVFLSKDFIFF